MSFENSKISNIIGTKLPQWVFDQLNTRSQQNSKTKRDSSNLVYLANKSSWIRLVSSININENDIEYFKQTIGVDLDIKDASSLAKEFVLFGGTSKYLNKQSYKLRGGFNDTYAVLGKNEVQKFGYRPMPGISSVDIQTQGRLGSVRMATVNFKCWDKSQLDIMDALYFKLGFTMFLEWGHTFFYPSVNSDLDSNKLQSTELYSLDPFELGLTKEEIFKRISISNRQSEGNYDAMLGIVSNFNFTYNQEGGYDCTIKLVSLGALGDSIKVNQVTSLQNILKEQIKQYESTLENIRKAKEAEEALRRKAESSRNDEIKNNKNEISLDKIKDDQIKNAKATVDYFNSKNIGINTEALGDLVYLDKLNKYFPLDDDSLKVKLNGNLLKKIIIDSEIFNGSITDWDINKDITFSNGITEFYQKEKEYGLGEGTYSPYAKIVVDGKELDKAKIMLRYPLAFSDKEGKILPEQESSIKRSINSLGYKPKDSQFEYKIDITDSDYASYIATTFGTKFRLDGKKSQELLKNAFDNINLNLEQFNVLSVEFDSDLGNTNNKNKYKTLLPQYKFSVAIQIPVKVQIPGNINVTNLVNLNLESVDDYSTQGLVEYTVPFQVVIEDFNIINDFTTENNLLSSLQPEAVIEENKQQSENQSANSEQSESPLDYLSSLELALRTIQVHSLTSAIVKTGNDLDIKLSVQKIELWNSKDPNNRNPSGTSFINQLFSRGIYENFISDLIESSTNDQVIDDRTYDKIDNSLTGFDKFKINAKYGFATNLMGNKSPLYNGDGTKNFAPVNYQTLLNSYVVPYDVNQELENGTVLNHPVYIPLGQFLMLLNHNCTVYDPSNGSFQTPLVYIDYNPNHNFCLSNTKQLSTDPFTCLIPFNGSNEDFVKLINPLVVIQDQGSDNYYIHPVSGSTEKTPLFNPRSENESNSDNLSGGILQFKYSDQNQNYNPYRGVVMNVLLNIDYLTQIVKMFSQKDGQNKVYLKPLIEQILTDINKSLGNINLLRLSYNDAGNVFQIVDDQVIPPSNITEIMLQRTNANNAELPLFGLTSIAKKLEIKTDISSKLSNMLAISANADVPSKSTLSTQGDVFGFINHGYKDRYIPNREQSISNQDRRTQINELRDILENPKKTAKEKNDALLSALKKDLLDPEKNAAIQFNSAIKSFYSTTSPSRDQIGFATNYYMDRMNNIKGTEIATRASAMIPVSVNFTTDGISGLNMYQAFTISENLLPYTYTARRNIDGKTDLNKVGFVIVGLNHTIQDNIWETNVRANMIFLKDANDYVQEKYIQKQAGKFVQKDENIDVVIPAVSNYNNYPIADSAYSNIKFGSGYLGSPANDKINPKLLSDINNAAVQAGVTVTITTAVGGHKPQTSTGRLSRHVYGNAVDIAIVDGIPVSNKNAVGSKVESFIAKLQSLGYIRGGAGKGESGNAKAILAYGFPNHDNHVHISNTETA